MDLELSNIEVEEKTDICIRPALLKCGLALAISLGGVIYAYVRIKRIKPSSNPKSKSSQRSPGHGSKIESRMGSGELWDDNHALQNLSLRKVSSQNSITDVSSIGRQGIDKDGYLLPEFDDLAKEYNDIDDICHTKNGDSLFLDTEDDEHDKETIRRLRNRVKILEEKERNMELQLLEYYGIKEQETAVMELQNRLRLNSMEAKLYNLKIESLLLDNRRLEAQVADHANAAIELESAKVKIKMLRKKLKTECEQNREQILKLQDKVKKLQLQEQEKEAAEIDQDLKERNELKAELEEMKKCNQDLKVENSDLAQKIEYVKMLAANAMDNEELLEIKEQSRRLKQQNEDSAKQIERLQADRTTDLEELVYLRWVNACLRYELRIYQPGGSKIIASEAEDKAKKMILEYYAHKDYGLGEKMDTSYSDSDHWSPSQTSCITEDSPIDPRTNTTNKTSKRRMFAKLRRLLLGKGNNSSRSDQRQTPPPLQRTSSVDSIPGRFSCEFPNSEFENTSRNSSSSRRSLDIPRSYSKGSKTITRENSNCSQIASDNGSSNVLATIDSLTEYENDCSAAGVQPDHEDDLKNELLKYAEAIKNIRQKSFKSSPSPGSG